ncbi:CRISPR-associated protein Cas8 [Hapalosiphon sp. MRB220]|nr:CRISPR-associated protein Cas8 [Hapalosiphon sp. MRB220]
MMNKNLFATILTYPAPSSNYRGESEENRTVLQKIAKGNKEYTVISPESMRNALREMLIKAGLPCNRTRLHDQDQLAVEFKEFPNAEKYADDFLFGFLVTDDKAIQKNKGLPPKRDSVLRMNMAVALTPYHFDTTFHQSPKNVQTEINKENFWKNTENSQLLYREVAHTAYQYPFALADFDCKGKPDWTKALVQAIAQLSDVAGGHARSYYEMAPKSIIARLTPNLVAGYDTYGFDDKGQFPELGRIKASDLPGEEFWIGGEIVRGMQPQKREYFENEGVHLYENPQKLLADLADAFLG